MANYRIIDDSNIEFPGVGWGEDFEIRMLLDHNEDSWIKKFAKALPKRFHGTRKFWTTYLKSINDVFCETFDTRYSRLRFSQISTDQCALFHTDNVTVRLFQTICGPGTEYLLENNVRREGLGQGCNSKIVRDLKRVLHATEKDILLMEGEKAASSKAFVHRLPPIEKLGLKRLYLSLDVVDDLTFKDPYLTPL
jgi:hypothetical protein